MNNKNKVKQDWRNVLSRIAGKFANMKKPQFLIKFAINRWCKHYKINISDYQIPNNGFCNFNEFFTRKIKENIRPIGNKITSPVDGYIYDFGLVNHKNKIFVKEKYYSTKDLIFNDFENFKSHCVLYLSPANYHRVHSCFDMQINKVTYLAGTLFSVKERVVKKKDNVYCRNERIAIFGNSEYGKFCLILVGALMVGKVKLSFQCDLETNIKNANHIEMIFDEPVSISKGQELGYFEMGSTVVLLLENENLNNISKSKNEAIRMGESLLD